MAAVTVMLLYLLGLFTRNGQVLKQKGCHTVRIQFTVEHFPFLDSCNSKDECGLVKAYRKESLQEHGWNVNLEERSSLGAGLRSLGLTDNLTVLGWHYVW